MITYAETPYSVELYCSNCLSSWELDYETFQDSFGINDNLCCPNCKKWQDYKEVPLRKLGIDIH